MIEVVIADDHPVVRDGISAVLQRAGDIALVAEASSGPELVEQVLAREPHVAVTDLRMPGGDGVDAIRTLRTAGSSVPILALTTYDTDHDIRSALRAGADGYLLKDAPREALIAAVRDLAAGRPVLSAAALRALRGAPADLEPTPRELDVLRELSRGGTNREAAARLFVSETTFKTHLAHMYAKLGVSDRAAAVRAGYEQGLI